MPHASPATPHLRRTLAHGSDATLGVSSDPLARALLRMLLMQRKNRPNLVGTNCRRQCELFGTALCAQHQWLCDCLVASRSRSAAKVRENARSELLWLTRRATFSTAAAAVALCAVFAAPWRLAAAAEAGPPADRCQAALLHFWPLDSAHGAADVVGGLNGALHGAASYESGPPGARDALRFDGTGTYVDVAGLDLRGAVSISLWARVDAASLQRSYSYIFFFANQLRRYGAPGMNPVTDAAGFLALSPHFDGSTPGWALLNWELNGLPGGDAQATLAGDAPPAAGWHHWLLVLDAFGAPGGRSAARVYLDGKLAGWSDNFGPLAEGPRAHLYLGRSGNSPPDGGGGATTYSDPLFAGALSHVRVLRGALGPAEAAALYRRPRDGGCGPPAPAAAPPGWAYTGCYNAPERPEAALPRLLGQDVPFSECFARAAAYSLTIIAMQDVAAPASPAPEGAPGGAEWAIGRCLGGVSGEMPYDALRPAECGPIASALPSAAQQIVYRREPRQETPPGRGGPLVVNVVEVVITCSFTVCSVGSVVFACGAAAKELLLKRLRKLRCGSRGHDAVEALCNTDDDSTEEGRAALSAPPAPAAAYHPPPPVAPSAPPFRECPICMERPVDAALRPCGHAFCHECASKQKAAGGARCATCRGAIAAVERIFLP